MYGMQHVSVQQSPILSSVTMTDGIMSSMAGVLPMMSEATSVPSTPPPDCSSPCSTPKRPSSLLRPLQPKSFFPNASPPQFNFNSTVESLQPTTSTINTTVGDKYQTTDQRVTTFSEHQQADMKQEVPGGALGGGTSSGGARIKPGGAASASSAFTTAEGAKKESMPMPREMVRGIRLHLTKMGGAKDAYRNVYCYEDHDGYLWMFSPVRLIQNYQAVQSGTTSQPSLPKLPPWELTEKQAMDMKREMNSEWPDLWKL